MGSLSLVALAASARPDSVNRALLAHAVAEAQEAGARVTTLDYAALDAPGFHEDASGASSLPEGANRLAEALLSHDGLLLASPEYNWSMPGSLKNLVDWLSVDPRAPLNGKPALLLSASPSVRGGVIGLTQLRVPLEHLGMWVYPQSVAIGGYESAGAPLGRKDAQYLRDQVQGFVAAARKLKA